MVDRVTLYPMKLDSKLSNCQLDLWMSQSALGFLWTLTIYWVPTISQAGAVSFLYNLT